MNRTFECLFLLAVLALGSHTVYADEGQHFMVRCEVPSSERISSTNLENYFFKVLPQGASDSYRISNEDYLSLVSKQAIQALPGTRKKPLSYSFMEQVLIL